MSVERPMVILQRSADLVSLLAERGALVPAEIAEYVDTPRSTRVPARRRSRDSRNSLSRFPTRISGSACVGFGWRRGPGRDE